MPTVSLLPRAKALQVIGLLTRIWVTLGLSGALVWPGCAQAACTLEATDVAQVDEGALHAAAQCALEQGDAQRALAWMQALLERVDYPVYHADHGRALLALGQYPQAMAAFERAMASAPPPEALRVLQHLHAKASQGQQPDSAWQKMVALGWVSDSNVNAGPSSGLVNLFGLDFQLDPGGLPIRATGATIELQLSRHLRLSPRWQSAVRLVADGTSYSGASGHNQRSLQVEWTPVWTGLAGGDVWRFPLGLYGLQRGGQAYQSGHSMGAQWIRPQGDTEWMAGGHRQRRTMAQAPALSADQWAAWAGWKRVLTPVATVQTTLRMVREHATDAAYSNRQAVLGWQLDWQLADRWHAKAEHLWLVQRNDVAESWASEPRHDRGASTGVQVTWRPVQGPQWSLSVTRQRTHSNLALYDSQRTLLKLGGQWMW